MLRVIGVLATALALVLALGAASAASTAGAASAAPRHVPRGWLGVVADGPLTEPGFAEAGAQWDALAGSGAEAVRAAFWWRDAQPDGPGATSFVATDPVVLAAAARGLGVLPVLQGPPRWASRAPGVEASPPRDPADFARWVTALVGRYGPRGTLWAEHPEIRARPVRAWQVWNEPNLTRYWNAPHWARDYVRLLRVTHRALRAADPGARTILAGLPNASWLALRAIYRAGARGSFDAVALHPYTGRPRDVVRLVELARAEMRRARDARRPVWVTELSWPAALGRVPRVIRGFETDDRGQATRLRSGIRLLAVARRRLRIEHVYWYTWLSAEGGPNAFAYAGLQRLRDGRVVATPALAAFRALARRLEGCAKHAGDASRCA